MLVTPPALVHRSAYRGVVATFQRKRHTLKSPLWVMDFQGMAGVPAPTGAILCYCAHIKKAMKNLTLSADEKLIEKARREAARRGKSLNQLIRDYLAELAGERNPATTEFDRLRELSRLARGHRGGWRFDREELHERS